MGLDVGTSVGLAVGGGNDSGLFVGVSVSSGGGDFVVIGDLVGGLSFAMSGQ